MTRSIQNKTKQKTIFQCLVTRIAQTWQVGMKKAAD
jgi:hypothetical protein